MSQPHRINIQKPPSTASPLPMQTPLSSVDVDTVIFSFLEAFPEPTDEQVHHLAFILGINFEDFEEKIFELFGQEIEDSNIDLTKEVAEPLDVFLISYFLLVPQPSEEQIHALAPLVGLTPEALEERIYSLLADLSETTNEDEGEGEPAFEDNLDDLADLDEDDELSGLEDIEEDLDDSDTDTDDLEEDN